MNEIRDQILKLSLQKDISDMGLREIARKINPEQPPNPQTIKYHLKVLRDRNEITVSRPVNRIQKKRLGTSDLVRIPLMGTVSAGPATQIADSEINEYIHISSSLLQSKNHKDLFALKVVGESMNNLVSNGDYIVVDRSKRSPKDGDRVVAKLDDDLVTLKKFVKDNGNKQIVLVSESKEDFSPIFVDPSDDKGDLIQGTFIQALHMPQ